MSVLEAVLARRRLVLTVAVMLAMSGAMMWLTMVRQEDPRLPDFWGQVVAAYPGADAETVETHVLEPVEDALAQVEQIKTVTATAFDGVAVLLVELRGDTRDIDEAWDEVRQALEEARHDFPAGAMQPVLDEDQQDQDSVVLAVTGSPDPLALLAAARRLSDALLALPQVKDVDLVADPGEQVTVAIDDPVARRLGLSAAALAARLEARNRLLPGGSLSLGGKTLRLRPLSEFGSVAEIAASPVVLPSGAAIPLGEVAQVRLGPEEPIAARMRLDGKLAVGLAVVPRPAINLVAFGRAVRERIAAVAPELAPLEVGEVTFQPARTEVRLAELGKSLLLGILIVAGVLVLTMGPRLGLLVASVVPLVAMSSLALFAWGGGVLHQISIAALVLALGMLVDNAIVVSENVQWRMDRGAAPRTAALEAVRELARPLAAATATTVAAFVPMLISDGPTAVFTRTIPVVIMLTLTVSYLFAGLVTPILSELVLIPRPSNSMTLIERAGERLATVAVRRSRLVLVAAAALVGLSFIAAGQVRQQFFPTADRNQFVVTLKLAEGSHLTATDAVSRTLEQQLLARPDVVSVAAFLGRSAPRFYYNVMQIPFSPHLAQLVVETRTVQDVDPVIEWIRGVADDRLPEGEVVARKLEQGPPVNAPVEVRLFGDLLPELHAAARVVASELERAPGAVDVRHDLGPGAPSLRFQIDDAAAARHGLSRADVAMALYGRTRGLRIGELRTDEDPIPVVVRSAAGEGMPAEDLETVDVVAPDGSLVPLAQVARLESAWRPAAIRHHDGRRVVTVSSQLADDTTFSDVLAGLAPRLATADLPVGVDVAFGGDAEGSGEANSALMGTVPIGLLLLLGVLLAEFDSFRRVGIILVTVPLAAAGVIPGLLVGDQPFGFMSLLGVTALVGIVVNNAIVLLEVVEHRRREGADIAEALTDAVSRRIRPILLTTATTVAGLLPLAFASSTLWPPLASAMISGLLASTLLTLVVVPAMYHVMFAVRSSAPRARTAAVARAAALLAAVALATPAAAVEPLTVTLRDSMAMARTRPAAHAADERTRAADAAATVERRLALLPTVAASAAVSKRDRELELVTPIGSFPLGTRRATAAVVELNQPLFDPSALLYGAPAARLAADAQQLGAERVHQELAAAAGLAHLEVLAVDARTRATRAFVTSLEARLAETEAMVDAGRALSSDALKVELALDQARQDLLALEYARGVAETELARAIGHDGPVVPLPSADLVQRPTPSPDGTIAVALEHRADVAALATSSTALGKRRQAVRAEAIPRFDARATWTWNDGSPYSTDRWFEGAVAMTWVPFAAATRGPRAAAVAAEQRAVDAELEELARVVEVEVGAALAGIGTARGAVSVGERGVVQATETLRVERERHLAGRATTNDLLEAEAVLRDRRTLRDLARLHVVRAWITLWLAVGEDALPQDVG